MGDPDYVPEGADIQYNCLNGGLLLTQLGEKV